MLWADAELKGFVCPIWMTYRQAQELGGQVKKGEHGSLVVYADKITRTETDESGEESAREIAFMKGYTVFNCEQIEGLPAHFYAKARPPGFVAERIAAAESFAANTGAIRPARRQPGLLFGRWRLRADAALRVLPRRGELLRDALARAHALDAP